MCKYFDSGHNGQHVFVLHGLGGSGKSQLAFKFLEDSKTDHRYDFSKNSMNFQMIYNYINFRFSDIFYIDATNQQTLEADLMAISPTNVAQSVAGCHQWLKSQHGQNWLLLFDNADDVHLNLATFFPDCRFGNVLVTTRNPQLSIHARKDGNAKVADMHPGDAKCLLMEMSQAENSNENETLAALIVKVISFLDSYLESNRGHRNSIILHLPSPKPVPSFITITAPH